MDRDEYTAAPLTPKQKRWLRVGVTIYLFGMGSVTVWQGDYSTGLFYAILTVADFYFYTNLNDWVKLRRRK